jgi:putative spermidine/putrescine transport system substrate-binding protein
MLKGAPNAAAARQFLDFAAMPAVQARVLPNGGLAKGVLDFMPADSQTGSPVLPANLSALLPADEAFWRENGEKLAERFNAWQAR